MTNSGINRKGKRGAWKHFSILFLLLLYGMGSLEIASIHSLLHNPSEEAEAHTAKDENDACHQSIYHNLKSEDCNHKAHLTALKKCPLCQLSIQTMHLASRSAEKIIVLQALAVEGALPALAWESPLLTLSARAPPVS